MKKFQMWLCAAMVICSGCLTTPAEDRNQAESLDAAARDDGGRKIINLPVQVVWSRPRPGFGLSKFPVEALDAGLSDAHSPDGSPTSDAKDDQDSQNDKDAQDSGLSLDELPNAILISTCESEPDEVAVPWPTHGYHFCETIQAIAYRADENGAYPVSASFSWDIQDDQVAIFATEPGSEHKGIRHPIAKRDIFGLPELDQEPETEFVVCAEPLGGWPPGYGPLCRTLPIRAVVNMNSPWCFSGASFQSDCDFIQVSQDGRYLAIEPDGQGSIWGKEIHFYLNGLFYQATLSDADNMQGTVTDPATQSLLGSWSAYKYTM
ncbi:MAG: hypothetical protein WC750_05105 [Patescibacteria group bacterium]|jgi:hypothetical protein